MFVMMIFVLPTFKTMFDVIEAEAAAAEAK
jgi:type II secretory pathway component PulF